MSSDIENQQVVVALMEEEKTPSPSAEVKQSPRSKKNYCSEDFLVPIGVPVAIVLLVVVGIVLVIMYIRKFNQNCAPTKGVSCRGSLWYFN